MMHPRELIARARSEEFGSAERKLVASHVLGCEACRHLAEELAEDERRLRLPEPATDVERMVIIRPALTPGLVSVGLLLVATALGLLGGLGVGTFRAGVVASQQLPLVSSSASALPRVSVILGTPAPGKFAGLLYNTPVRAADGWHFTGTVTGGPASLYNVRLEIGFPDGSQISTLVASSLAPGESVAFELVTTRLDITDWSPRIRWVVQ